MFPLLFAASGFLAIASTKSSPVRTSDPMDATNAGSDPGLEPWVPSTMSKFNEETSPSDVGAFAVRSARRRSRRNRQVRTMDKL